MPWPTVGLYRTIVKNTMVDIPASNGWLMLGNVSAEELPSVRNIFGLEVLLLLCPILNRSTRHNHYYSDPKYKYRLYIKM